MGIIKNRDLDTQIKQLKDQQNSIVFTNGCFDLLHKGHIDLLNKASIYGDILIVGLNSDSSVKTLKGQGRPIENERTSIVIQSNTNHRILYRQIAGAVARRICNYAKQNDIVDQSLEAGFIKFGSRIDVFVPKSAEIKVKLDDTIVGGETILAII